MTRNKAAFHEIANWKLEAKLENSHRYFYITSEVESLMAGDKSYVIGRKGTGKTAIANFIKNKKQFDQFNIHLTLKNFPFNLLYELRDGKYTAPNEYITIWKYIIYSNALYLMVENEGINAHLRRTVAETIPMDPKAALSTKVSEWTSGSFKLGFQKFSAGLGIAKTKEPVEMSWVERTTVLEKIVFDNIDSSKYFILFDELDEDYKYHNDSYLTQQYMNLITGLFKAVQDVKAMSIEHSKKLNPVVF